MSASLVWLLLVLCVLAPGQLSAAEPTRPVIFLPGVLGSKLCDAEGSVLWGGLESYSNLDRLALGLEPTETEIKACGVVDSIKVFGPLEFHKYDTLLNYLRSLGYQEGRTLFIFDYDWRQSNFESARRLREFIRSNSVLRDAKLDLVGHSMGGIVARIYIQELGGDRNVRSLTTLGTPHRGSLKIFRLLREGFTGWGNFLAGGRAAVRQVAFTFPSAYELLPFYDWCCALGHPDWPENAKKPFDFLDPRPWFATWLPEPFRADPWHSRIEENLKKAGRLQKLLTEPIPPQIQFFPVAGDHFKTYSTIYVNPGDYKVLHWAQLADGDGTVLSVSASAEKIARARVAFNQHAVIFRDGHFQAALGRILADSAGGPVKFTQPEGDLFVQLDDSGFLGVTAVDLSIAPRWLEPGKELEVILTLDVDRVSDAPLSLSAWLELEGAEPRIPVQLTLAQAPKGASERIYKGRVTTRVIGTHRIILDIPGFDKVLEQYLVVGKRQGEGQKGAASHDSPDSLPH